MENSFTHFVSINSQTRVLGRAVPGRIPFLLPRLILLCPAKTDVEFDGGSEAAPHPQPLSPSGARGAMQTEYFGTCGKLDWAPTAKKIVHGVECPSWQECPCARPTLNTRDDRAGLPLWRDACVKKCLAGRAIGGSVDHQRADWIRRGEILDRG